MDETATTNLPIDESILDELVPPPGPRWRRVIAWVAFLGIVGGCIWATTTGTVVPKVSMGVDSWGSGGPRVMMTTYVVNRSRVDVEVVAGPRPRPGLSLFGYTTGDISPASTSPTEVPATPFPLRLQPGEDLQLTVWYDVTDCRAIGRIDPDDDRIDLQFRIAAGPASWITAERTIDAPGMTLTEGANSSWPAAIAKYACPS